MNKAYQVWTQDSMAAYLSNASPEAIERAIVRIYQRQTSDEQASQATKHTNNMGFSAFDAGTGSYMAKWILSGKHLSGKWVEKGRKLAVKYRGQLVQIANAKVIVKSLEMKAAA